MVNMQLPCVRGQKYRLRKKIISFHLCHVHSRLVPLYKQSSRPELSVVQRYCKAADQLRSEKRILIHRFQFNTVRGTAQTNAYKRIQQTVRQI